jgi:flagellar protein FliL
MAEEKQTQEEVKGNPPSRGMMKWIALAVLVVVLGGGGFAGWSYLGKTKPEEGQKEQMTTQKAKKEEAAKELCPLDSFIVNLMDKSIAGKRYLKVTLALEVGDEQSKLKVDKHKTQLRDTIILLLSSQGFQEVSTVEGKLGLKQEILSRVNQILGAGTASRIYFTEFVVQ